MTSTTNTVTQADRLRVIAELLDAHPDLPAPSVFAYSTGSVDVSWQILRDDAGAQRDTMNEIRRAIGGEWQKDGWDDRFDLTQRLGDGLNLQIIAKREAVCERRVTGVETVTLPAVAAQPERTVEREIVEWDCSPILSQVPA